MPASNSLSYRLAELREGLKPFRLHFYPTLGSTNAYAGVLRRRGELFAPAVVLTSRQTAGRGRGANTWFSSRGTITATFVFPESRRIAAHHLPLASGLAIRNAVASIVRNEQIQLKWPNDIIVPAARGYLKLAGLLCERLDGVDLVGVGLNVRRSGPVPAALRQKIGFLEDLCPPAVPRQASFNLTKILISVGGALYTMLARNTEVPFATVLAEYDRYHGLVGKTITVSNHSEPNVTGRCIGLDDAGRLLLKEGGKTHRVIAGHVEMAGK